MAAKYRKGPDGGWGWWVVFASFLSHFIVDGVTYTGGLFLESFQKDLKASASMAALVVALLCGLSLITGK